MEERPLPKKLNPYKLAAKQEAIGGFIDIRALARISEFAVKGSGKERLDANMRFGIDDQQYCYVKGHVQVWLSVVCQRCLLPFELMVESNFCVSPINHERDAAKLPRHYDPVMCLDGTLDLSSLLEDEVLLELPAFPKHAYDCTQ